MENENKIRAYYASLIEEHRLASPAFLLEGIRSMEIISRHLHGRLRIADIGGGAGHYAFWLKSLGHEVHFLDLSRENVEAVGRRERSSGVALDSVAEGNALSLPYAENTFDLVLLLGPLYHMTIETDRMRALAEAGRVLKPGGRLIAAVISRYASLFDGYHRDLVMDPAFFEILKNDLRTGIHQNDTDNPEYFTTAFFHTPGQIRSEIEAAGLQLSRLAGVEGFGWIIPDLPERIKDEVYRSNSLKLLAQMESNLDLIALSPHIIAEATKT